MAEEINTPNPPDDLQEPVSYFRIGAFLGLALLAGYLLVYMVRDTSKDAVEFFSQNKIVRHKLPDGSLAYMNGNSYIKHPKQFDETQRLVNASGEFWLELNPSIQSSFMFAVPGGVVQLNNGKAHVRAYPKEGTTEIHLVEGSGVFDIGKGWFQQLTPGDHVRFISESQDLKVDKFSNENFISWQSDQLNFDRTPLPEVLRDLSRHFRVRFIDKSNGMEECIFSGNFKSPKLNRVMEAIFAETGLQFVNNGDEVEVKGGSCLGEAGA